MYNLDDSVISVSGVGKKYQRLLEKLDIYTVKDLLYHFPFRYDDFSKKTTVQDVKEGETVTIEGLLGDVKNIFTRNRKRLTTASIIDYTGELEIVWFNQHYLKKVLMPGKWYTVSGKIGSFGRKLSLISPDFEIMNKDSVENGGVGSLHTGRLVPIYPETAGLSSKWLRTRINDVLSQIDQVEEFLPEEILKRQEIPQIDSALTQIHFPENKDTKNASRRRFAFEEIFLELLKVEQRKQEWSNKLQGIQLEPKSQEIRDYIDSLPFELTNSQIQAVEEIIEDVQKKHPMNRLLEGDVGTGKTIVAVIAAYHAHLNGYKTLYMAPTEILAKQHYETFTKFLGKNLNLAISTSSSKENLDNWDILIGTHSLLFNEYEEKIGLIIIDEQHRFGVEQRAKLIELGKEGSTPHLLSMTATPIPRTLALTLYGDLSISILKEHPNKLRKITTRVVAEKQRDEAYKWILQKGEPTFIVCPLIEESESAMFEDVKAAEKEYKELKKGIFKDVNVGLLHGRMKNKEKEDVVNDFRNGKIKILVSTPVIEVGIDIPDATVIVIESAERYGLASLHQLRGRVGRGEKPGFCFAFMSSNSRNSYSRLKHLETVDNGLELAEIDMKIRGHGDIFGTMQHGFKKFKIADITDLSLLETASKEAQKIFPEVYRFPKLKKKIGKEFGKLVKNN